MSGAMISDAEALAVARNSLDGTMVPGTAIREDIALWIVARAKPTPSSGKAEDRGTRLPSSVLHMLADYKRKLQAEPSSLPGYDQTEQEERRKWLAEQIGRIDRVFADQQLETVCEVAPAQPALTADEGRALAESAVRDWLHCSGSCGDEEHEAQVRHISTRVAKEIAGRVVTCAPVKPLTADEVRAVVHGALEEWTDRDGGVHRVRVADRVVEKLTGRAVSAEQRVLLQSAGERTAELEATVETMKAEVWEANEDNHLCGRLAAEQGCLVANKPSDAVRTLANRYAEMRAKREADLREAFIAGVRWGEGFESTRDRYLAMGDEREAAAEYARSKAAP